MASEVSCPHTPDFYLWGNVKDKAFKKGPKSIPELKSDVTKVVRAVTTHECQRVTTEVRRRIEIWVARNGGHFEHVL